MSKGNDFVSNLRLWQGKHFSGLTDTNQLKNAMLSSPKELGLLVSYAFGALDDGYSSTIDFVTGGLGNTEYVETGSYRWEFEVNADRAIKILKATWLGNDITAGSNLTPGLHGTPVKIWLEHQYFGPGSIIEFDDKRYQARIEDSGVYDDGGYVYTIMPSGETQSSYIPPHMLIANAHVSRLGSAYPEFSSQADILNYSRGFKLENSLTTIRIVRNITGHAAAERLAIVLRDPVSGKETYFWAPYMEWVAMREWHKRMDYQLVHEQATPSSALEVVRDNMQNAYPVIRGAGLRQQISPANIREYTVFTADLINEYVSDLTYNIIGATKDRKFLVLTGEMGMKQFHNAMMAEAAKLSLIDTHFVNKAGENLSFGAQFTTYKMLNGAEVSVKLYPPYDDMVHNRTLHPITKKPIESYRYTFLEIGRRDGKSNLVKMVRKGREFMQWSINGSTGPNGATNGPAGSAVDGYEVHMLGEVGVRITDPRGCGELIFAYEG